MQLVDEICADNNENAAAPAAALEEPLIKKAASNVKSCFAKEIRLLKYVVLVKSVLADHAVQIFPLLVKMLLKHECVLSLLYTLEKAINNLCNISEQKILPLNNSYFI